MEDITTVMGNFPNTDITHRPKRKQSEVADKKASTVGDTVVADLSEVPQNPTIESSIVYLKSHSDGAVKVLYKRIIDWLKELLEARQQIKEYKQRIAVLEDKIAKAGESAGE